MRPATRNSSHTSGALAQLGASRIPEYLPGGHSRHASFFFTTARSRSSNVVFVGRYESMAQNGVGAGVGAREGLRVGAREGAWVGDCEGFGVGGGVGACVGAGVGAGVAMHAVAPRAPPPQRPAGQPRQRCTMPGTPHVPS